MEAWKDKVINAKDVAKLYHEKLGDWLLIEVLKTGKNGKAELFKLLAHSKSKDGLHDHLMDDENWSWERKYIMVYADPEKVCEL